MSYQRVNRGTLRVQMNAEQLYNCNYMAFRNTAFGNKWFYAFVNRVEYINNITTEISYEIDLIQTWFFQFKIPSCFVERIHAATDEPGDNLVPEGLETGEYIADSDISDTGYLTNLSIVVAAPFDVNYDDVGGGLYSNIFSGLCFTAFPNTAQGADQANAFITGAGAKAPSIVSVFLMPTAFITAQGSPVTFYNLSKAKKITGTIDGYTPKNNKLFTYPYNFLYVTNLQGNSAAFPYEFFTGQTCDFQLFGDMSPNPSVILEPMNYKGLLGNLDEKMVLTGYPQAPYNIDAFKAWLAMNGSNLAVDALSTGSSLVLGAATGNPEQVLTGVMGAFSRLSQVYAKSLAPLQSRGGGGSITNCAATIQDFFFIHKHIKAEFARIIDDFFTMYGYACHQVMVPNRKVRSEWTYIKTVNCKVEPGYPTDAILQGTAPEAGLPAEDARRIEQIHNNGITYWVVPGHLGDYITYPNDLPTTAGTEGGGTNGEQTEP